MDEEEYECPQCSHCVYCYYDSEDETYYCHRNLTEIYEPEENNCDCFADNKGWYKYETI